MKQNNLNQQTADLGKEQAVDSKFASTPESKKKKVKKRLILILAFLGLATLGFFHTRYIIHPVSGSSMEPTIHDGAQVVIEKTQKVQRYSVVAFSVSKEPGMFVKRIVGIPGDSILVQKQTLILDLGGKGTFQSTLRLELSESIAAELAGKTRIPPNYYFMLGDNTDVSQDSRRFGYVKKTQIEGVLKSIFP